MPGNLAKEVYQKRCCELIQEAGQLNGMTAGGLMMPIRMRLVIESAAFPSHMKDILEYRTKDYYWRRYRGKIK